MKELANLRAAMDEKCLAAGMEGDSLFRVSPRPYVVNPTSPYSQLVVPSESARAEDASFSSVFKNPRAVVRDLYDDSSRGLRV